MSDLDPLETREWLDALNSVVVFERRSADRRNDVPVWCSANTPYLNTSHRCARPHTTVIKRSNTRSDR